MHKVTEMDCRWPFIRHLKSHLCDINKNMTTITCVGAPPKILCELRHWVGGWFCRSGCGEERVPRHTPLHSTRLASLWLPLPFLVIINSYIMCGTMKNTTNRDFGGIDRVGYLDVNANQRMDHSFRSYQEIKEAFGLQCKPTAWLNCCMFLHFVPSLHCCMHAILAPSVARRPTPTPVCLSRYHCFISSTTEKHATGKSYGLHGLDLDPSLQWWQRKFF